MRGIRLRSYCSEVVKGILREALESKRETIMSGRSRIASGIIRGDNAEEFANTTRVELNTMFYLIDSIATTESSSTLYDYLDCYLREFKREEIGVIILRGAELSSLRLIDFLGSIGVRPSGTHKSVWLINVPVSTEMNPFDWPIVLHELGHMIEHESLRILQGMGKITNYGSLPDPNDIEGKRALMALEYLCDLVAFRLAGPVVFFRVMDAYLTQSFAVPKTHPEWYRRLAHLMKDSTIEDEAVFSPYAAKLYAQVKEECEKEEAMADSTYPPYMDEMKAKISGNIERRRFAKKDVKLAFERLSGFQPYTQDASLIITCGYLVVARQKRFKGGVKEQFSDEYRLVSEFQYLVSDCIRLTRLRSLVTPFLN